MTRMGMQSSESRLGPVVTRGVESPGIEPEKSSWVLQLLSWVVAVTGAIASYSYVGSVVGLTLVLGIMGGWDNLLWLAEFVLVPPAAAYLVYRTLRLRGTQTTALRVGAALWTLAFVAALGFAMYQVVGSWS